jgi:hypothetical protein
MSLLISAGLFLTNPLLAFYLQVVLNFAVVAVHAISVGVVA